MPTQARYETDHMGEGGEALPTSQTFAHSSLPGKIPPASRLAPPNFYSSSTKASFSAVNNNLNSQNHSMSDSHHPIKNSPGKIYHPTALREKDFPLTA